VILFVSGEYPPDVGGVGDYTVRLRASLDDLGWQSRVLTRRQVHRWDARSLIGLLRSAPRSGVVHIQFQAGAYDLLGDVCLMPALLRRLRPGLRSVTTFHDVRVPYLFPRAGRLRKKAIGFLARTSDAVVAADERDLRALAGVSRRQFHVPIGSNVTCSPPPGFDRDALRLKLGIGPGDLAIVYFGLLNAGTRADTLFAAFERVRVRAPRARLLLLGASSAACAPKEGPVIQPGWLPPAELSAYLLAGNVALLPYADGASARHGSLLACSEHGLPIVSTEPAGSEVASFVEVVPHTPGALADAVLDVAAAPAKRIADSRALAELVSWERIAREHVRIYDQLLHSER
jgi:glycosyltransferase involved in cell wall biosynthesis